MSFDQVWVALLSALGRAQAVWVGHDWGSPVVWNIASHHPEACVAVASLCVPYNSLERGLDRTVHIVDRELYPVQQYPLGQWEYMKYYLEHFDAARSAFEADPERTARSLFRAGDPGRMGSPTRTALVSRKNGGWFPVDPVAQIPMAPDVPRDADVITEQDLATVRANACAGNAQALSTLVIIALAHLLGPEERRRAARSSRS